MRKLCKYMNFLFFCCFVHKLQGLLFLFQITELQGNEQVLKLELNKVRELLEYERKKYNEMEAQVSKSGAA